MNTHQEKIQEALQEVSQGMSLSAASKKYDLARSSLRILAKKHGVVSPYQKQMNEIDKKKQQAIELRRSGSSFSKIAKSLSICETTAKTWCEGIVLTAEQNAANSRGLFEKQEQAVELRKNGLFITEIAKQLNCAKSSVSLWLSKAKVGQNYLKSQRVSKRIVGARDKKVEERKKQIKNTSKKCLDIKSRDLEIFQMRKLGLSFVDIAEQTGLNKTTVRQICNKFTLSSEEQEFIKNKVHETTMKRRHSGELKPVGGIRQGVERSKFGYYKGIYCSSTYELCWAIYQLDHGVEFKRFEGFLEDKKTRLKYYPDFIIGETHIIEIKGYEDKEFVAKKTKLAEDLGYTVSLVKKKDLKHMFEYVDQTYGVKYNSRHTLYDNHKPVHLLVCDYCNTEFERFKIRKADADRKHVFCSTQCCGKHRAKVNKENAKTIAGLPE